jgi:hypothetical protein
MGSLLAAPHIAFWMRREMLDDVRRPPAKVARRDTDSPVSAALPTLDL